MRTILGALIGTLLVAGCAGATGSAAPAASAPAPSNPASVDPSPAASLATPGATPSASGAFGGTVQYQIDGAAATTEVGLVAAGATVSGTAVTAFRAGTHTVQLACATRNGDTWALGGTTEQTTVSGERVGDWSAVIVKDGSPQQIGIWLGEEASAHGDCEAWLASIDFVDMPVENFEPVASGALVPPPDLAP